MGHRIGNVFAGPGDGTQPGFYSLLENEIARCLPGGRAGRPANGWRCPQSLQYVSAHFTASE